jgi:RNA polymerase sigma-70 factor (ECF subfamily)
MELQTALAAVSEEHREPFLLIEVFGMSYQETADVLGVRVGTVKSRMHRARKAMMGALEIEEEDAGGS